MTSVEPKPEETKVLEKVPTEVSDINEDKEEIKEEKKKKYDDDRRLLLKNGGFDDEDIEEMEKETFYED